MGPQPTMPKSTTTPKTDLAVLFMITSRRWSWTRPLARRTIAVRALPR
jgi:hypothetical protein